MRVQFYYSNILFIPLVFELGELHCIVQTSLYEKIGVILSYIFLGKGKMTLVIKVSSDHVFVTPDFRYSLSHIALASLMLN